VEDITARYPCVVPERQGRENMRRGEEMRGRVEAKGEVRREEKRERRRNVVKMIAPSNLLLSIMFMSMSNEM
jgi:hypothetical protein